MAGIVTLQVTAGPLEGKTFTFEQHDTFLFGRAEGCHAVLAPEDTAASRHHFLLEVSPPDARLRDLGSRNGTYVNGVKHGGRAAGESPEAGAERRFPDVDIGDGDRIEVGATCFRVQVTMTACHRCGREIPPSFRRLCRVDGGPKLACSDCRERAQAEGEHATEALPRCGSCGRVVPEAAPAGSLLCAECGGSSRADPLATVRLALQAASGSPRIPGYEVGDELARGGQGAVYRARRSADGREVAFKVMLAKVAVDEPSRLLFRREIEVTRSLRHPNVVELLEHGSAGVGFFFAMELCRGGSVEALMRRRRSPLSLAEAAPLMLQALAGLAFAHEQKFVHRDLKPGNILLGDGEHGPAKIADFGLAKSFERAGLSGLSATNAVAGTLAFMPAEQLTSYKYARPAGDVWSMAASLYFMLSGALPREFGDRDPIRVILGGEIVPLAERGVTLPAQAAEVLERALAPKADDRYPDAGAFREALAGSLGQGEG